MKESAEETQPSTQGDLVQHSAVIHAALGEPAPPRTTPASRAKADAGGEKKKNEENTAGGTTQRCSLVPPAGFSSLSW